ncbi:MAG: hypothetical protein LBJ31_00240 [Treponema sp.]|jgi:glycosidase|nr:hypothetical protein [Treponema sp.]
MGKSSKFSVKAALEQIAFSALTLGNRTVYQVNVRNYSREGTFKALEKDLDRVQDLGIDYIQLLPIHPIGVKNRKGTLGSPYAISNYRAINPELGKEQDFYSLVQQMHRRGIGCIMDIVFNHTSPDSILAIKHPDWFIKNNRGLCGKIDDWTDVVDLDYENEESGLWEYQIETLKMWARIVDGFRCDVAALVPVYFWGEAWDAVHEINPRFIWIAESVEPSFIMKLRERGYGCHSDGELYTVFNVCYDYDVLDDFKKCAASFTDDGFLLEPYIDSLARQDWMYPENYIKLRCLENHDQERAAGVFPGKTDLRNWTAFSFFQKGLGLIHAGQEIGAVRRPDLFEKDPVDWTAEDTHDMKTLVSGLVLMRKDPLLLFSSFHACPVGKNIVVAFHSVLENEILKKYEDASDSEVKALTTRRLIGVFGFHGKHEPVNVNTALAKFAGTTPVKDGVYGNRIGGRDIIIKESLINFDGEPVVFEA